MLFSCIVRADAQEAQYVHAVDLAHPPAALQEAVVSGVDKVGQRQLRLGFVSAFAAFVGKSLKTSVVCVCTAMSASAMSCMSLSTG